MLKSRISKHPQLNRYLIRPKIEPFMVDHIRDTRPHDYNRYMNGGLWNVSNRGLKQSLRNLP
jgi:hypothetical protein